MKVLSLYVSATGGTETFQRVVQKVCENYEIDFTEVDLTNNAVGISEKWLSQFDAYLIGTPVVVFSVSTILQSVIKSSFTNGLNKKVVFYTTSATGKHSTIYGLANLLKNRGYIVTGVVNVKSMNSFYYLDRYGPRKINTKNEIIQEFELQARVIKELLITSTNLNAIQSYSCLRHLYYVICFNIINVLLFKSFSLRNFQVIPAKCKACGICAQRCPTNNISMHNNRPTFGNHCLACSRCIQACPNNAIAYKNREITQMNHITIIDFQKDYHF